MPHIIMGFWQGYALADNGLGYQHPFLLQWAWIHNALYVITVLISQARSGYMAIFGCLSVAGCAPVGSPLSPYAESTALKL